MSEDVCCNHPHLECFAALKWPWAAIRDVLLSAEVPRKSTGAFPGGAGQRAACFVRRSEMLIYGTSCSRHTAACLRNTIRNIRAALILKPRRLNWVFPVSDRTRLHLVRRVPVRKNVPSLRSEHRFPTAARASHPALSSSPSAPALHSTARQCPAAHRPAVPAVPALCPRRLCAVLSSSLFFSPFSLLFSR